MVDADNLESEEGAITWPSQRLIPSLQKVVEIEGLDPKLLTVLTNADENSRVRVPNRHEIWLFDGNKSALWHAPSLREMCRGNRLPPSLKEYPPEYTAHFLYVESHLLPLLQGESDPTDQELEEVYSCLRRRPDGRSLSVIHNFLWQVAASLLGQYELSSAELEAIFGRLEQSVRGWAIRPISRNYVAYLRDNLHPD